MMSKMVRPLFAALLVISLAGASSALAEEPLTRDSYRNVAKNVSPAVVNIKVKSNIVFGKAGSSGKIIIPPNFGLDEDMRHYLEHLFEQQSPNWTPNDEEDYKYARSGSGVIIRPDGYLVTSNHVIAGVNPEDIEISLPDGRSFDKVKVIGSDDLTDLAVLKFEGKDLPSVQWGDSDKMEVGDHVLAIGNPLEFNNSVSEGIVSAKHRIIKKAPIEDLIQTTAMINPGNSGGALVNLDNQLVGINMAIATSTGLWSGMGFAIPSKVAKDVTDQIIEKGKVARGYLGIEMAPLTANLARQLGYDQNYGIVVGKVTPGTAAEKAGLQLYDIIAKVNGNEIKEIDDMHRNIGGRSSGDTVELEVYRDEGSSKLVQKNIKIVLTERPPMEELNKTFHHEPKLPGKAPEKDLMGLTVSPSSDGKGVTVDKVEDGSAAALADIRAGDVILQVNKQDVKSKEDALKALNSKSGDGGNLFYIDRKGQSVFITISAAKDK